jgi:carboxyl-terminal processing protease
MDPSETKLFSQDMQEQFDGVGIQITAKDKKIVIVSVLADSPAKSADIKTGDEIVSVDGKTTEGRSLMEVLSWIRGEPGSKVKLELNREGYENPKEFEFTRYNINVESVKYNFDNNIAYIQISQFSDNTTSLVQKAADEIVAKKPKGIILDLRGNPGGLFDSAVEIASLFIEKGAVVYERDKNNNDIPVDVKGDAKLKDFPLVVLVDNGSASASEILSGALAYYKKGTLVGEKTFGKGVMQSWDSLPDGSSLILTIKYWLTPGKVGINEKGITPDITIKSDKTNCSTDDTVCNKAKEILNK